MNRKKDYFRPAQIERLNHPKMNRIKTIILVIFFSLAGAIVSKATDKTTGIWIDMAVTKKVHSFILGITSEVLTKNDWTTLERVGLGCKADYPLFKWLNAGVAFSFLDFKRTGYYELKERYYVQLEPFWHISNFYFSFRERLQLSVSPKYRDLSPDSYYWRNRFEAYYKPGASKLEPLVNFEEWYHIGDYNHSITTGYRISLGANYRPTPREKFKIYGMLTDGTIISQYIVGVSCEFKL